MSSSKKTRPSDAALHPTRQMLDELDTLMERMLSLPVEDREAVLPPLEASIAVEEPPPVLREEPVLEAPLSESAPTSEVQEAMQHVVLPEAEPAPLPSPPLHLQGPHLRPLPSGKIIVGRLSAPPLVPPSPPDEERSEELSQATALASEQPIESWSERESDSLSEPMSLAQSYEEAGDGAVARETEPFKNRLPQSEPIESRFPQTEPIENRFPRAADEVPDLPSVEAVLPLVVKPAALPRRRSVGQWAFKLLLGLNQAYDRATAWLGSAGRRLRSARGRNILGAAGLTLLALAILWCLHDWLGWNWLRLSLE